MDYLRRRLLVNITDISKDEIEGDSHNLTMIRNMFFGCWLWKFLILCPHYISRNRWMWCCTTGIY